MISRVPVKEGREEGRNGWRKKGKKGGTEGNKATKLWTNGSRACLWASSDDLSHPISLPTPSLLLQQVMLHPVLTWARKKMQANGEGVPAGIFCLFPSHSFQVNNLAMPAWFPCAKPWMTRQCYRYKHDTALMSRKLKSEGRTNEDGSGQGGRILSQGGREAPRRRRCPGYRERGRSTLGVYEKNKPAHPKLF